MAGITLAMLFLAHRAIVEQDRLEKPRPPTATMITGPDQLYFEPHQDEQDGMTFNYEYPWLESRFEKIKGAGYGVIENIRNPFGPNPHAHTILTPDIITPEYNARYAMNMDALETLTARHWLLDPLMNSSRNNTPGSFFVFEPVDDVLELLGN